SRRLFIFVAGATRAAAIERLALHQLRWLVLHWSDEGLPGGGCLECIAQRHAFFHHLVDFGLRLGRQASCRHNCWRITTGRTTCRRLRPRRLLGSGLGRRFELVVVVIVLVSLGRILVLEGGSRAGSRLDRFPRSLFLRRRGLLPF